MLEATQITQQPEPVSPAHFEYRTKEPQTFRLRLEDDFGAYEVSHTFAPLGENEEALFAFDNEREITYQTKGKETEINPSSAAAAINLYDRLVRDCDGYGEEGAEKPHNWRELVPAEDKIAVINDLLFIEIREREEILPGTRRRAWGDATATKTVETICYFDGREVSTSHTLKAKTAAEIMAYDRIKARVKIGKQGISLKPQFRAKGELYNRLLVKVDNYVGGVPMHHKAAVITAYFENELESAAKKLSSR